MESFPSNALSLGSNQQSFVNYPQNNSNEIYKDLIPNHAVLFDLKITRKDITSILSYVHDSKEQIKSQVIKRDVSKLGYTIACAPHIDSISTYIFLKLDKIASGGNCNIKLGWDINSKKAIVIRTSLAECILDTEKEINLILSIRKDLFVVGDFFDYKGSFFKESPYAKLQGIHSHLSLGCLESSKSKNVPKKNVDKTAFILEYCPISLSVALDKKISFKTKCSIAYQILNALAVLHDEFKIVHLDIKTDNILLSKDLSIAKLGDFGSASFVERRYYIGGGYDYGTKHFTPPELLVYLKAKNELPIKFETSLDMWSFGVLMIHLFLDQSTVDRWDKMIDAFWDTGRLELNEKFLMLEAFKSRLKPYLESHNLNKEIELLPLFEACLKYSSEQRITAAKARDFMNAVIQTLS